MVQLGLWNRQETCAWGSQGAGRQYGIKSSEAKAMKYFNVISEILKSILKHTSSQCEDAKTGVIWSHLLILWVKAW